LPRRAAARPSATSWRQRSAPLLTACFGPFAGTRQRAPLRRTVELARDGLHGLMQPTPDQS